MPTRRRGVVNGSEHVETIPWHRKYVISCEKRVSFSTIGISSGV
jgi:hypothetical protein